MVLVGNKSDLPDDQREVSLAIGKDQASAFNCPFFESSAKVRLNPSHPLPNHHLNHVVWW